MMKPRAGKRQFVFWKGIVWMMVIWALSVLALGIVSMVFRFLMSAAGMKA
ncbi:hypothetical protein ACUY4Q_001475 [Phytobacter sp. AG2a]